MAIAGLWRETEGEEPPAFTMLTTAPSPDVEPYHDRQVGGPAAGGLGGLALPDKPEAELLRPLPRRVDCAYLATLVATGRLAEDEAFEVAHDLAYRLAKQAYQPVMRQTTIQEEPE